MEVAKRIAYLWVSACITFIAMQIPQLLPAYTALTFTKQNPVIWPPSVNIDFALLFIIDFCLFYRAGMFPPGMLLHITAGNPPAPAVRLCMKKNTYQPKSLSLLTDFCCLIVEKPNSSGDSRQETSSQTFFLYQISGQKTQHSSSSPLNLAPSKGALATSIYIDLPVLDCLPRNPGVPQKSIRECTRREKDCETSSWESQLANAYFIWSSPVPHCGRGSLYGYVLEWVQSPSSCWQERLVSGLWNLSLHVGAQVIDCSSLYNGSLRTIP